MLCRLVMSLRSTERTRPTVCGLQCDCWTTKNDALTLWSFSIKMMLCMSRPDILGQLVFARIYAIKLKNYTNVADVCQTHASIRFSRFKKCQWLLKVSFVTYSNEKYNFRMPLWVRMSDGMWKLSKSNLQNEKSSSFLKWKHQSRNDSRLSRFVTLGPKV